MRLRIHFDAACCAVGVAIISPGHPPDWRPNEPDKITVQGLRLRSERREGRRPQRP